MNYGIRHCYILARGNELAPLKDFRTAKLESLEQIHLVAWLLPNGENRGNRWRKACSPELGFFPDILCTAPGNNTSSAP